MRNKPTKIQNGFYPPYPYPKQEELAIFSILISLTGQGAIGAAKQIEEGRGDKVANIQHLGYTLKLHGPHGITKEEAREKIERALLKIREPVRNAAV